MAGGGGGEKNEILDKSGKLTFVNQHHIFSSYLFYVLVIIIYLK